MKIRRGSHWNGIDRLEFSITFSRYPVYMAYKLSFVVYYKKSRPYKIKNNQSRKKS